MTLKNGIFLTWWEAVQVWFIYYLKLDRLWAISQRQGVVLREVYLIIRWERNWWFSLFMAQVSQWLIDEWKLHLFSPVRKWYDRTLLWELNKCSIPIFQSGQHCNIEVYHYVMTTSSMDRQVELNVPSLFVIGDTVAWVSYYIAASLCNT